MKPDSVISTRRRALITLTSFSSQNRVIVVFPASTVRSAAGQLASVRILPMAVPVTSLVAIANRILFRLTAPKGPVATSRAAFKPDVLGSGSMDFRKPDHMVKFGMPAAAVTVLLSVRLFDPWESTRVPLSSCKSHHASKLVFNAEPSPVNPISRY